MLCMATYNSCPPYSVIGHCTTFISRRFQGDGYVIRKVLFKAQVFWFKAEIASGNYPNKVMFYFETERFKLVNNLF